MGSFLRRFLLDWQTRSLGVQIERLMVIIPVAIYFDHKISEDELSKAKEILRKRLSPSNLADLVFKNVQMRLEEYQLQESFYLSDRQKALEILIQDIQLYGVLREILEASEGIDSNETAFEEVIKKNFDEAWKLDMHDSHLLEEQTKHYERELGASRPVRL